MKKRSIYTVFIICLVALLHPLDLHAQLDNEYHVGDQLLKSQKYEEAYRIFKKLHEEHPENFLFLEKATESLINLKRYEEAIDLISNAAKKDPYSGQASIRLGEIYHIKGDTAAAFDLWEQTLEEYGDRFQVYLSAARAMNSRRAFGKAIEVYQKARERFSNSTLLATELANTYMQAGNYEKAINEYLNLVEKEPERIDYVQRSLLRFDDKYLYDTAILEIGEFLETLSMSHPSHRSLHQLELWLLLERELYRRALAAAKAYEAKTSQATYTLYGLGSKLLSEQKFELAEQAYQYYINNDLYPAKHQSMEELARVYTEWADYLSDHNLAHSQKRESLYQQAFDILQKLNEEAPYYDQMGRVLIRQAELAIDYLHDVEKAESFLGELRSRKNESTVAQEYYVEGRIKLYKEDYARARIAFTKSNKQERIGDLAEKTRYYLALTDFYAGDYEFAKIQLNALEKQRTSYYANDAVQLRIWIQKGLNADSTGSVIDPFAAGVELFNKGNVRKALAEMAPIISGKAYHPLMDEALLLLSKNINPSLALFTYAAIDNYLARWGQVSSLRERLMWEKARIADQVVTGNLSPSDSIKDPSSVIMEIFSDSSKTLPQAEEFFGNESIGATQLPSNKTELQTLYENILLEFPNGFYASFARERIQELKQPQT